MTEKTFEESAKRLFKNSTEMVAKLCRRSGANELVIMLLESPNFDIDTKLEIKKYLDLYHQMLDITPASQPVQTIKPKEGDNVH